jgi:hypothetical protein
MERTFVSVGVQSDSCEFDLSEVSSVPLGRPWPREDEDTSHIQHGYYRRYDGTLGKVKNGVKLTDSQDDHSSSQSAKRARYDPDDVSSSQESMLQKCETCGHEWNDGSQCEHSILKHVKQPVAVETFEDQEIDDEGERSPQHAPPVTFPSEKLPCPYRENGVPTYMEEYKSAQVQINNLTRENKRLLEENRSLKEANRRLRSLPSESDPSSGQSQESIYYRCMNTFMKDGEEIQCDGETNGSSQLCHACLQPVKRSFFV